MSYEVKYNKKLEKFLKKLAKKSQDDFFKINDFLRNKLPNCENPCALQNAKHLQGFSDNRWRWRIGVWRIIGIVENGKFKIIKIIEITRRDDTTYSHTKK